MIKFNKMYISMFALNHCKLSLYSPHNWRLVYKQEIITNDLKSIIQNILNDTFDNNLDILDVSELDILYDCLSLCHKHELIKELKLTKSNSESEKNKMIHKFQILKNKHFNNEINNDEIIELKELIQFFKDNKKITNIEYNKLLKSFDEYNSDSE